MQDLNVVNEILEDLVIAGNRRHTHLSISAVSPSSRNVNLNDVLVTSIDSVPVLLNYVLTLLAVRSLSSSLHVLESVLERNDVSELEESRLEDSVDTSTHTCLFTELNAVDDVEVDIVLSDISLYLSGEVSIELFGAPDSVEEESTAGLDVRNHIVLVDIALVMTGNEISLVDEVSGLDRSLTETEV